MPPQQPLNVTCLADPQTSGLSCKRTPKEPYVSAVTKHDKSHLNADKRSLIMVLRSNSE